VLKVIFIVAFIINGTYTCLSQTDQISNRSPFNLEIKLAYNSSLIYPGVSIGVAINLKKASGYGNITGPSVTNHLLGLNLGWYHHPGFHDNLYLTAEWIIRKTGEKGFYSEFSLGPGYSRTFPGGITYKVADDGTVTVKGNAGYNYALFTFGAGIGHNFQELKNLPLSAFAKMNLLSMFPYNSTVYFRPVLEMGTRVRTNFLPETGRGTF